MMDMFTMVEIEINSDCNRSCPYCPNSIMKRKEQGEMSRELFERIINELASIQFNGRLSYHFYGEPLLCRKLHEFVRLTRSKLPSVTIFLYSNGDFLDQQEIENLTSCGVDKFIVTNHQGDDHPFKHVLDRVPMEIKQTIEYVEPDDLHMTNRGGLLPGIGDDPKPDLACIVPSYLLIITVLGNILACFNDYEQTTVMGNILDQSLMEIWNTEKYREFRENHKQGKRRLYPMCRTCNHISELTEDGLDFVL